MADPYISRKEVNTSYRPKSNLMSPGLKRAREPFRFRNALTGLILAGFAFGVWGYSISAVKQDDFSDIDEEAKALARTNPPVTTGISADSASSSFVDGEGGSGEVVAAVVVTSTAGIPTASPMSPPPEPTFSTSPTQRGVIAKFLEGRSWGGRVLDPTNRTLVWGAPSVDNAGRLQDGKRV